MGICLSDLAMVAQLAGWAAPNVPNGGRTTNTSNYREDGSKRQVDLRRGDPEGTLRKLSGSLAKDVHRFLGSGLTGILFCVESQTIQTVAASGVLNPEHSRWLMGYQAAWGCCAATAIASSRKLRRGSSKRSSKRKQNSGEAHDETA
jgi:hypothetical protein